jgi:hypothetical protein
MTITKLTKTHLIRAELYESKIEANIVAFEIFKDLDDINIPQ